LTKILKKEKEIALETLVKQCSAQLRWPQDESSVRKQIEWLEEKGDFKFELKEKESIEE